MALLVLLAGCNGLAETEPTDERETLTPVEPRPPAQTYPPGVTEGGVTGPGLLAAAHDGRTAGRSYTLRSNRTVRYDDGSVRSHLAVEVALAANRTYHARVRTAGPEGPVLLGRPPASAEFWADGDTYLRTLSRDNATVYNEITGGDQAVVTWRYWTRTAAFGGRGRTAERTLQELFGSFRTNVTELRASNDTTRYRVRSDRLVEPAFQPPAVTAVENGTLEATVTGRGLVESVRVTYNGTVDGRRVTVVREIAYDDVGSTAVGRPTWAGRALGQGQSA